MGRDSYQTPHFRAAFDFNFVTDKNKGSDLLKCQIPSGQEQVLCSRLWLLIFLKCWPGNSLQSCLFLLLLRRCFYILSSILGCFQQAG